MAFFIFRKEFSEIGYNDLQQRIMQWAMQVAKVNHMHKVTYGGVDERYNGTAQFNFSILSKDQCVRSLLGSWYISPSITNLEQDDDISQITCMHENFINVRVQGKYSKYELQAANLEQSLNDDLLAELIHAYQEELGCTEHLATQKVKYFKSISYTIVDKDDQVDVNLRVGDIVDVLEDISSDGETNLRITTSYAKIQAIFIHKKNQQLIPFLLLNWFILLGINDPKLDCSRYRFQRLTDRTWRRIYAIKWVDHQPNVHFVHQCRTGCYDGKHDETNVYYLYNDFYYNAI
ncbi:unnamed protein product [Rhizophagus irregularis]|nr:unnamed protein product [Rhizophagus irregularis]